MLELLEFTFSTPWTYFGVLTLVIIVCSIAAHGIAGFRLIDYYHDGVHIGSNEYECDDSDLIDVTVPTTVGVDTEIGDIGLDSSTPGDLDECKTKSEVSGIS